MHLAVPWYSLQPWNIKNRVTTRKVFLIILFGFTAISGGHLFLIIAEIER
jgi:hypothetical protein